MAPPPLPPDYGGTNSNAKNDMMDMGWTMPTTAAAPEPTAQPAAIASNTEDDWGNGGWGIQGSNNSANKPSENNNFQQAGGNPHTSSSSGFTNDFSSSKTFNSAANTNQVTLLRTCVVLLHAP